MGSKQMTDFSIGDIEHLTCRMEGTTEKYRGQNESSNHCSGILALAGKDYKDTDRITGSRFGIINGTNEEERDVKTSGNRMGFAVELDDAVFNNELNVKCWIKSTR